MSEATVQTWSVINRNTEILKRAVTFACNLAEDGAPNIPQWIREESLSIRDEMNSMFPAQPAPEAPESRSRDGTGDGTVK